MVYAGDVSMRIMVKQSSWGTCPLPFLFHMSAMQDGFFDKNGISALSLPESIHGYCISGAFSNLHGSTPPPPATPLTPQTMLDACIQNFFRLFYFVQGGRRDNCKKISKRTENYEYSSTVPRTFLQDWTCPYVRILCGTKFCRPVEWQRW